MPTYEYRCESCGHHFERFQSMSEDPIRTCPSCGGPVCRIIGAGAAVIFKGSGAFATDSRDTRPRCGRERSCCGRPTPCERRPCD
jgi:putative FmdB family regulatory protein